jgi:hypothetical protein
MRPQIPVPVLKVGDKVTVKHHSRYSQDQEGEVIKVGRTLYHVASGSYGNVTTYRKDNLHGNGDFGYQSWIETPEITELKARWAVAEKALREAGLRGTSYDFDFTLDQLEQLAALVQSFGESE